MDLEEGMKYGLIMLLGVGCLLNTISLSYFLRRSRRGVSNQTLIALNIIDFIYCVFMMAFKLASEVSLPIRLIISVIEVYCMTSSALLTTALSVTRTVVTVNPFTKIKPHRFWKLMTAMLILNMVFIVPYTRSKPKIYNNPGVYEVTYWMLISMVVVLFILTVVAGTITLRRLSNTCNQDHTHYHVSQTRKNAAVTVLLLVTAFCVTNMGGYAIHVAATVDHLYHCCGFTPETFIVLHYSHDYMTTLNAVLNPMIYIMRKRGIRIYIQNALYALRIFGTKWEAEPTSNTQTPIDSCHGNQPQ